MNRHTSIGLRSLRLRLRSRKRCHAKLNCTPSPQGNWRLKCFCLPLLSFDGFRKLIIDTLLSNYTKKFCKHCFNLPASTAVRYYLKIFLDIWYTWTVLKRTFQSSLGIESQLCLLLLRAYKRMYFIFTVWRFISSVHAIVCLSVRPSLCHKSKS